MFDRRGKQTGCRQYSGNAGHHNALYIELGRQRCRMKATGAAQRDQRKVALIDALPDRHGPNGLGHLRVEHAMNSERSLLQRQAQRPCDALLHRRCGRADASSLSRPPAK